MQRNSDFMQYLDGIMTLNSPAVYRRRCGGEWFDPADNVFFQHYLESQQPAAIVYYDAERSLPGSYLEIIGSNMGSMSDVSYYQTRLIEEKGELSLTISWDDGDNVVTLLNPMLSNIDSLDDMKSGNFKTSIRSFLGVGPDMPVHLFGIKGHTYEIVSKQEYNNQIWHSGPFPRLRNEPF